MCSLRMVPKAGFVVLPGALMVGAYIRSTPTPLMIVNTGDKFAVGHSEKRVTVHRVLDAMEQSRYLASASISDLQNKARPITSLEWIKKPSDLFWSPDVSKEPPPELYRRGYDAPGSAHIALKHLPQMGFYPPVLE